MGMLIGMLNRLVPIYLIQIEFFEVPKEILIQFIGANGGVLW